MTDGTVTKGTYAFPSWEVKGSVRLEWMYPGMYQGEKRDYIELDLISVRASDGIRISYDSVRDGWVIEQPTKLSWEADDTECDMGWKEAAFVQSWQFTKPHEADDA